MPTLLRDREGLRSHERFAGHQTMDVAPDLSSLASAIGDPTRIRMLTLLMDGRAATAKELAYGSGVTPGTATAHLTRLSSQALVSSRRQGRHKYFQLASENVAYCLESLMRLGVTTPGNPPRVTTPEALREARFCYDHLAGKLGTEIALRLVNRGFVVATLGEFDVTEAGVRWFATQDIEVAELRTARRKFAPACMDWSERRDHVGGVLGAAIAELFQARRWIRRRAGTREVQITPRGADALREWL